MQEPPRYPYLHVDVSEGQAADVAAELWDLGVQGLEERDSTTLDGPPRPGQVTLVAYVPEEDEARRLERVLGKRFPARVEFVVGDEWRDAWRAYFKPTRLGPRLVVRPTWETMRTLPGDVVLTLDPGRAFGSGTHESTRLVLRELDRRIRGGERVLDVGCGSGILSIAALLLGAERARAVDVDPDAVAVTRENALLNGVASRVEPSTTDVSRLRGEYDVVIANIEARVLIPLADAIAARVARGGWLILSGILRGQEDEVRAAYPGMALRLLPFDGDWIALVLQRSRK